jgi:hypothetical protein
MGVGTAMEMVDGYDGSDDIGTAIEVKVGKVFDNNFVIEGQVTKTISSAKIDVDAGGGEYYPNVEMDLMTYSIWGKYNFPLSSDLTLSPKIGFVKEKGTLTYQEGNKLGDGDDSGLVYGIELKKHFTNFGFDIYAGYNIIEEDISHLSFGIQKSF